ncbi:MAG: hydrogenase [Methanomicrobiales archaeon]|nr:hydrogenase [Methanomicrobiales archaeon]
MNLMTTLSTGSGFWNPVLWLVALIITLIIAYLIWARGERQYKAGTEQVKPFISGNPEPRKGAVHIRAGNLYWGFTDALQGYYRRVIPLHTGILTDYLLWVLWVTALVCILVVV